MGCKRAKDNTPCGRLLSPGENVKRWRLYADLMIKEIGFLHQNGVATFWIWLTVGFVDQEHPGAFSSKREWLLQIHWLKSRVALCVKRMRRIA